MSVDFEWVGAEDCPINIVSAGWNISYGGLCLCGEADCLQDENTTDAPSIVIGAENGVVISAEDRGQLVEFARTLLRMTEEFAKS